MSNKVVLSTELPLLVIDSGLGGLLTFQALDTALPTIPLLYHGDSVFAPYGEKTKEFLENRVLRILHFFTTNHRIQGVVVACNTSASVIGIVIEKFCHENGLVYWPVTQGAKALFQKLQSENISQVGVLATSGTVQSNMYQFLGQQYNIQTIAQPCPQFVPLIESESSELEDTLPFIESYMNRLIHQLPTNQHIILGCTHYPLLLPILKKRYPEVTFLDPAILLVHDIQTCVRMDFSSTSSNSSRKVFISGDPKKFKVQMNKMFAQLSLIPLNINI